MYAPVSKQPRIRAPSELVNVKLSADGRFLVGVGRDKHARVWDTVSGKELYDYKMIDPTAKEFDLSLDGKQLLALSTAEGTLVVLYRAGEGKLTLVNKGGGFNVRYKELCLRTEKLAVRPLRQRC